MAYTCTICDKPCVLQRVSYTVNGFLFSGVPVMVCSNPDCCKERGATVVKSLSLTKPPTESDMRQREMNPQDPNQTEEEWKSLKLIYDDWVAKGKPGYFSDFCAAIEDVADAH